jgi:lysophospholipase L1-like esterase
MISKIKNRPRGPRKVVCLGDSITADGVYGKILESKLPEGSSVTSLGYVGQGVRVIYSHLAEALRSNPTDLVVLAGVNDLGGGRKAKDIIVDLELLWTEIKRSGARLVVIQVLPWAGYPTSTPAKQEETKALNKLIKNSKIPDAIINTSVFDNGSGRLIGAAGSGDGLHPGKEGKIILGRLIHEQGF